MKKKMLLACLVCIMAASAMAQTLTVGSYNIRYSNTSDSINGNGWAERCPPLCNQILWEHPDVLGVQEVLYPQLLDLERGLEGYKWLGVGRDDGKQAGEYAAIFYLAERVELLDDGSFWLNETPDRPALGWDAACVRICTWGHFRDRKTGRDFFFLNLHMDHVGLTARSESARLVMQRITALTGGGQTPAVLTGDFNVSQEDSLYTLFTRSGVLKDCYSSATRRFAENGTFNAFKHQQFTHERIDHIFVTPATTVEAYAVRTDGRWRGNPDGTMTRCTLSDHYPVFARINLMPSNSLNIVFIGNSITAGATLARRAEQAPPAVCGKIVEARTGRPTYIFNGGHSGITTFGFLPGRADFRTVCDAARELTSQHGGTLLFSIMLGTNDSACSATEGAPVAPATYEANMRSIIEELVRRFPTCRILLNYPIWYSPNTYNSARYLQEGQDRLLSYYPVIDKLAKEFAQVDAGNRKVWKKMRGKRELFTPEKGHAGTFYLHPNAEGAAYLAALWADGIVGAIR